MILSHKTLSYLQREKFTQKFTKRQKVHHFPTTKAPLKRKISKENGSILLETYREIPIITGFHTASLQLNHLKLRSQTQRGEHKEISEIIKTKKKFKNLTITAT